MANITASMVKELREMTGAGMMECKKALAEAEGEMEKAVDVLRTRGLAAVAKKAGRATNEGTVMAVSYTHLDVYKRQARTRTARAKARTARTSRTPRTARAARRTRRTATRTATASLSPPSPRRSWLSSRWPTCALAPPRRGWTPPA